MYVYLYFIHLCRDQCKNVWTANVEITSQFALILKFSNFLNKKIQHWFKQVVLQLYQFTFRFLFLTRQLVVPFYFGIVFFSYKCEIRPMQSTCMGFPDMPTCFFCFGHRLTVLPC